VVEEHVAAGLHLRFAELQDLADAVDDLRAKPI